MCQMFGWSLAGNQHIVDVEISKIKTTKYIINKRFGMCLSPNGIRKNSNNPKGVQSCEHPLGVLVSDGMLELSRVWRKQCNHAKWY